jgi:hypothetical protein
MYDLDSEMGFCGGDSRILFCPLILCLDGEGAWSRLDNYKFSFAPHLNIRGAGLCDPPLMWVDKLLIAGLFFFVALLLIFLGLIGLLLSFVLLAFVSHSFLLGFPRILNLG